MKITLLLKDLSLKYSWRVNMSSVKVFSGNTYEMEGWAFWGLSLVNVDVKKVLFYSLNK